MSCAKLSQGCLKFGSTYVKEFFSKMFWSIKIFSHIIVWLKRISLVKNKVFSQKNFRSKNFLVINIISVNKNFGQKFFQSKNFFSQRNLLVKKNFGQNFFSIKNFSVKSIFSQNIFQSQHFFSQNIF